MPCHPIKSKDGLLEGFICTGRGRRKKCKHCDRPATLQCDFKLPSGKLCNVYVCDVHGKPVGPNLDYCPLHSTILRIRKESVA